MNIIVTVQSWTKEETEDILNELRFSMSWDDYIKHEKVISIIRSHPKIDPQNPFN